MEYRPDPNLSNYPRANRGGKAEKIQTLAAAYYGLGTGQLFALLGCVLSFLGMEIGNRWLIAGLVGTSVFFVANTLRLCRLIGDGADWDRWHRGYYPLLVILTLPIFGGILGYSLLAQLTINELKKLGVSTGFFGVSSSAIKERLEEISLAEGRIPTYLA